jgi:signal transduction histidine kinase
VIAYDAQQIEQVLINLIQNATQAMPNGGQLVITLAASGDRVTLTVRDTGFGIPSENLRRIFDPFFTTKGEEGTGLGLSVSYGIIARHHGTIRVESTVGQGTTFIIVLPTKQPDPLPAGA